MKHQFYSRGVIYKGQLVQVLIFNTFVKHKR